MTDYQSIIDKYYPEGLPLRDIYLRHCRQVADKAIAIATAKGLLSPPSDKAEAHPAEAHAAKAPLRREVIEAAAMLHDIGIFLCDAPGIECKGKEPYLRHGLLGADLLRSEGVEEEIARVAERHTGAGITREEIIADDLPLPLDRCFLPETLLERLICYADKFFSKSGSMEEKSPEKVMEAMTRFGPESYARFRALHTEFTIAPAER